MLLKKLLGPHLGGRWIDKLELLRKWQPPFVLVLQPEVDKVKQLRAACPNAVIVGRFYHDDNHYASNIAARPKEFAREIHQEIIANPATPLLDYVQSNNEVCQDWTGIQKLNVFALESMHLADQSGAYKCAILAFSVGNPDMPHKPSDPAGFDGRMLYWQQVLPSLNYAQRNNHLLLLHAYGYPNMFAPDADWFIYRYERQVQANLRALGITSLKYAYGEIGIDRLIANRKGGYRIIATDQNYVNQLLRWERDQQGQSLLLGGAIFTFGDSGGWDTYDIATTDVASMLATHYADHATEYTQAVGQGHTPPVKGNDMTETLHLPQVISDNAATPDSLPPRNISADFKRRVDSISYASPEAGESEYVLTEAVYLPPPQGAQRFGPDHHILVDVIGLDGKRKMGETVNFYTLGGKQPKKIEKANDPYGVDCPMFQVGHAWGVWVGSKPENSDVVWGMGLGTIEDMTHAHHVTYYLVFQEAIRQATTQTAPQPTPVDVIPLNASVVTRKPANIRSAPTFEDNVIEVAPIGTPYVVTGDAGEFYEIVHSGVAKAYVHESVVSRTDVEPTPAPSGDKWERSYAYVRRWEGGHVDDPNDPGGATNKGITLGTYTRWRKERGQAAPTKADLWAITDAEVEQIYREWYWLESGADKLPWPLCLAHFDTAINAGPGKAKEMLAKSNGSFMAYVGHVGIWYTTLADFQHFGRAWSRRRFELLLEASKP